jgi:hypothetical protein
LVCVLGVAVSASVFGVTGLELVGPPVESDWAWAPAVLVVGVLESEPVCALAGKAMAFLFGLFVAIFARIHPSLKESLRLDDSDDFDKRAVARQSGKIIH